MQRWYQWAVHISAILVLWFSAELAADNTLPSAPEGSFSIVVIPDTQTYHGKGTKSQPHSDEPVTNTVLDTHIQWIVDNLQRQRIVFVSHVGDIVDKNLAAQWEVARRAMDRLHGQVPYAMSVGNHDMAAGGDASLFQKYFPASRFAGLSWYGGTITTSADQAMYGNNVNSFQLFSAGGLDFVFVHLECNAPDRVLRWADDVLARHARRRALVTTHMNLGPLERPKEPNDFLDAPKGRMQWKKIHGQQGNTPQQMWDKCFRKHPHLFMVFSGDQSRSQAMRLATHNDAGHVVHELLSDYGNQGGDWLRICRFLPRAHRIEVSTFDSRNSALCDKTKHVPDRRQHQFTLEYDMSGK